LTAAFDVVDRNLIRKRLKIIEIPVQLIHLLDDWLSDRSAYCEVNKNNYEFFDVNFGTIQGSILGTLLFALFISLLTDIATSNTYADDNYLFSSGEIEKKALENCIKETIIAMKWFLNSGFCVTLLFALFISLLTDNATSKFMQMTTTSLAVEKQRKKRLKIALKRPKLQ
jgi:hypothetical protein